MSSHIFSENLQTQLSKASCKIFDLKMWVVCLLTFIFISSGYMTIQLNKEKEKNVFLEFKINKLHEELQYYKCQDFDFYKSKGEDYYKELCVDYHGIGKITVFKFGGLK